MKTVIYVWLDSFSATSRSFSFFHSVSEELSGGFELCEEAVMCPERAGWVVNGFSQGDLAKTRSEVIVEAVSPVDCFRGHFNFSVT